MGEFSFVYSSKTSKNFARAENGTIERSIRDSDSSYGRKWSECGFDGNDLGTKLAKSKEKSSLAE